MKDTTYKDLVLANKKKIEEDGDIVKPDGSIVGATPGGYIKGINWLQYKNH